MQEVSRGLTNSERAARDIPALRHWLRELLSFAEGTIKAGQRYDSDDDFAFMSLSFTAKQVVHTRAVLLLDGSPDAALITRSMLEGLCLLLWSNREHKQRSLLWRAWAYVVDWRQSRRLQAEGCQVSQEQGASIAAGLQTYGHLFVRRNPASSGDPYRRNWLPEGVSLKHVFAEVKGDRLYEKPYAAFSAWHHWSIEGFGPFTRDGGETGPGFAPNDPTHTAAALSGAFLCLWQTLELLDNHLALGLAARLEDLRRNYNEAVSGPRASGSGAP